VSAPKRSAQPPLSIIGPDGESCSTCKFARVRKNQADKFGLFCQRYPKQMTSELTEVAHDGKQVLRARVVIGFCSTEGADWCGEYKKTTEKKLIPVE